MRGRLFALALSTLVLASMSIAGAGTSGASTGPRVKQDAPASANCKPVQKFSIKVKYDCMLSSGGRMFFNGPSGSGQGNPATATPTFGTNVDAADPNEDVASGQSETAIAANGSRVVATWNDASGFFVGPSTRLKASLTGVGYSSNGGAIFKDLVGLPNNNGAQQWFGDPTVVNVDPDHFIIASLYLPSFFTFDCGSKLALAVSVMTIPPSGLPTFTMPIIAANGGSPCNFSSGFLDKDFLSYDSVSRTLAMSYTNFKFNPPTNCGNGEIDIVRATVPADPATLTSADFSAPIVVGPEIGGNCNSFVVQEGAYPAVAPGGDIYVAWERNWISNLFNGQPYAFIQAVYLPSGSTTVAASVRASLNQPGANQNGGFKSLVLTQITGYTRFIGNDFPRIAYDSVLGKVILEWNAADLHPLGDIFLKAIAPGLADNATAPVYQVNDDSDFTLHFLPAVSVRSDGAICSSWYDRRLGGPSSTLTDYWGECRSAPGTNGADFRITTGSTDWNGTGSIIDPNFGDYTDNTSSGLTTYYLWADGRIGIPNPFADKHT